MKLTLKYALLFLLVFAVSCKKKEPTPATNGTNNNNNNNPPASAQYNWIRNTSFIEYAADGVTETYKSLSTYDNSGRPTGSQSYENGVLISQTRDYSYNGTEVTYYVDSYSNNTVVASNKYDITYTSNWITSTSYIAYATDGVTETYKSLSTYNGDGSPSGGEGYSNGTLSSKTRDYTYNGSEAVYYTDSYTNNTVSATNKYDVIYTSNWITSTSYISYATDGVTESYKALSAFNSNGSPSGSESYENGVLISESRDYTYNGNQVTYYIDTYTNNSVTSTRKISATYLNN